MAYPFGHHETAPMIALAWGGLAPIISTLIVDQPTLAPRLVLAPRRVVHALATYIHHALGEAHDNRQIGRDIERQDVRVLLTQAVPNLHPRFYRMLDRLGPSVLEMSFYTRLNDVLHGPGVDLLLDVDEVTDKHLDVVVKIVADPVLLAARKAVGWSPSHLQHLQHALVYLRAKGLSHDIERLPPGSGWKSIMRRISSDIGRAQAPKASFEPPNGWRQIEDVAGLWRVGTALGNCVSSFSSSGEGYVEQLISGDAAYLSHEADPPMLACIRKVGPNLWTLSETTTARLGSDIMRARDILRKDLIKTLAATGGALLEQAPLAAIRSIAWRAEHGSLDVDDLDDAA